jgi:hypothetical protein
VQLSTAIVFGLSFATLLTLCVTPASLILRADLTARKAKRAAAKAQAKGGPDDATGPSGDQGATDGTPPGSGKLPEAAE